MDSISVTLAPNPAASSYFAVSSAPRSVPLSWSDAPLSSVFNSSMPAKVPDAFFASSVTPCIFLVAAVAWAYVLPNIPAVAVAICLDIAANPPASVFNAGWITCIIGVNAVSRLAFIRFRDFANSSFCPTAPPISDLMPRNAAYNPAIKNADLKADFTLFHRPCAFFWMPLSCLPTAEPAFLNALPIPEVAALNALFTFCAVLLDDALIFAFAASTAAAAFSWAAFTDAAAFSCAALIATAVLSATALLSRALSSFACVDSAVCWRDTSFSLVLSICALYLTAASLPAPSEYTASFHNVASCFSLASCS